MIRVSRPIAGQKKINHKDSFELCYLRHKYIRRSRYNPTPEEMKPFEHIAYHLSMNTYKRYGNLFSSVGFEFEDVFNIAKVHAVSFLGLFAMQRMPDKYADFVKLFESIQDRKPMKRDILDKNQANFTLFLKQRMEDVVRVCRQKVRNIKGLPSDEYYYYYGPNPPPKSLRLLVKNHEKYGFRKLDVSVFKTIKRKAGLIHSMYFDFAGSYYIAIPIGKPFLTLKDLAGANLDPRDNIHNMNPEERLLRVEEGREWDSLQEEFFSKPNDVKINIFKNFIRANRTKRRYAEEVKTARRLLRTLE
jgi:hypothetical protein